MSNRLPDCYVFDGPTRQRQEQRKQEARHVVAQNIWLVVEHLADGDADDEAIVAAIERVLEEHENGR